MAENAADGTRRVQRVLGVMAVTVVALSMLAIAAVLIAGAAGVTTGEGLWVPIALLPLIGLPTALLFMIAFIVVSAVARSRQARAEQ